MSKSKEGTGCACGCACEAADSGRRSLMAGALKLAMAAPLVAAGFPALSAQPGGRSKDPQVGDKLAFMIGPKQGQEILPEDMQIGEEPVLAYPMDPGSGQALPSRAGLLTLVRLDPGDLSAASAKNAAGGIVAFSSLCTHYGCPVTTLHPSRTQIVCNCHGSVFDAANRGAVTQGPATRRLAMLPLEIRDGSLFVAGAFDGPIGPPT